MVAYGRGVVSSTRPPLAPRRIEHTRAREEKTRRGGDLAEDDGIAVQAQTAVGALRARAGETGPTPTVASPLPSRVAFSPAAATAAAN
jgi:hypothetical protein